MSEAKTLLLNFPILKTAFCNNIEGLMEYLDVHYTSSDWYLFIDSSTKSLKDALMYKNNLLPTIPVAYTTLKRIGLQFKKYWNLLTTILMAGSLCVT